jgi:biofilm PGA synthesis N-glycosyltransferase PgaC
MIPPLIITLGTAVLYLLTFLLIWVFSGYPLLMLGFTLRNEKVNKDYSYQPLISVVVPTYNEEAVIENRIQNLRDLEYPKEKYEILVVDSGSVDATKSIIQQICQEAGSPQVTLVCQHQRMGKASAINCGATHASGDIILVTDANSVFDRRVLAEVAPHFKNSKIGGVGGRYVVANPENPLPRTEQFYWELECSLRSGETAFDSACLFQGEINAWRKSIVDADTTMIGEDLDMSIMIRKKGYKVVFEPDAICYEPTPTSLSDQLTQKKRRCLGTIQNMFKHWQYLLVPKDWYRLIIFPSHKGLLVATPFMFAGIFLCYILIWNVPLILGHLFITSALFLVVLFLYLRLVPRVHETYHSAPVARVSLLRLAWYVLFDEYLLLLAWRDFLFGRYSVLWEKIDSTRAEAEPSVALRDYTNEKMT